MQFLTKMSGAVVVAALVACGPGKPSESSGREAFTALIDGGDQARIRVTSFEKTDGVSAEPMGIPAYVMSFAAEAEFSDRAMFSDGNSLSASGSEIRTSPFRQEAASFSWNDFADATFRSNRRAYKGDKLRFTGQITFGKTESGWSAQSVEFQYVHDSTGRVSTGAEGRTDIDVREAVRLMADGKREEARGAFFRIATENPQLVTPHVFLARIARDNGDITVAQRELDIAIRLEPESAVANREMGTLLLSLGQYDTARTFFVQAVRINPLDSTAQGLLGCTLLRLGRRDEGMRFISKAGPGSWSACAG